MLFQTSLDCCDQSLESLAKQVADNIISVLNKNCRDIIFSQKVLGIMQVDYMDDTKQTIAALSGDGNVWELVKNPEYNGNNLHSQFDAMKTKVEEIDVDFAPFAASSALYQQFRECISHNILPPEDLSQFADAFKKREEQTIEKIRKLKLNLEEIKTGLTLLGFGSGNLAGGKVDFDRLAAYYLDLSQKEPAVVRNELEMSCSTLYDERDGKVLSRCILQEMLVRCELMKTIPAICAMNMHMWFCMVVLVGRFGKTQVKHYFDDCLERFLEEYNNLASQPEHAARLAEKFLASYGVPYDTILTLDVIINTASGSVGDPRNSRLANSHVQCAEDNALLYLVQYCKMTKKTVKRISWYSCQIVKSANAGYPKVEKVVHKPLCGFCKVAFKPRATAINALASTQE